jgi:hypothetical protein
MRCKASVLALAAVLTTGLTVPTVVAAATVLKSRMTGAQIVNEDGGAPRGVAQASLTLNEPAHRICFEISYHGLGGKATGGYLRRGRPGDMARPAVVLFAARGSNPVSGCVDGVDQRTIDGLAAHPAGHYVDLTTARFPKGAVRGQLRNGGEETLEGPPSGGVGRR